MDQPQKKSPWRRRLRRAAIASLALAVVLAAWVLFFPVPLGWAVRFAATRALPANGPLQLDIGDVTFRWRWGEPALRVEAHTLRASAQGRPLLDLTEIVVDLRKSELWQRRAVPTLIAIAEPRLTLDQTPSGALAVLAPSTPATASPPTPSAPTTPPSAPPNFQALTAFLSPSGEASKLMIAGLTVRLKNAAGEMPLSFGRIETTLAQTKDGTVQLDFALPLLGGVNPPALAINATLETRTGRTEFSIKLPAFSTGDLPIVPGSPPLPLRATVAVAATGNFNLATAQLEDIAGGLTVKKGAFFLPDSAGAVLPIEAIEVRGRYDLRAQHALLETARARIGSLAIEVQEFDATLGPELQMHWRLAITGPKGAEVLPLLPAHLRTTLPLSPEAIGTLSVDHVTSEGRAYLARASNGTWSSRRLDAKGEVKLALGREPLAIKWSAVQPENSATTSVESPPPASLRPPGRPYLPPAPPPRRSTCRSRSTSKRRSPQTSSLAPPVSPSPPRAAS